MPLDTVILERLQRLRHVDPAKVQSPADVAVLQAAVQSFSEPVDGYEPPSAMIHNRTVPGPHGEVPVRIYAPTAAPPSGIGLLWLHGGGFVAGDLDMPDADVTARELCVRTGAVVISVQYRLAHGGVAFPIPHDDVMAAWRWTFEASRELGIEPDRMALGGASAGGNLAAGVALALRDNAEPLPAVLLLAYPLLHDEVPALDEVPVELDSLPLLLRFPPSAVTRLNQTYRGGAAATPYAVPGIADLSDLPPTVGVVSEYDDLRPSGERFATALRAVAVPVLERCEPGVVHGYLNLPGISGWRRSIEFLANGLIEAGNVPNVKIRNSHVRPE